MPITFFEISRMSLFRGFSEEYLSFLDIFFEEHHYKQDELIVESLKLQDRFFMLISGEVEIYRIKDSQKIVLDTLQAGSFFGEINLFDPGLSTANVRAVTPVCTLEISNTQFRSFIKQRPDLAADFTLQLAETIVRRYRQATDVYETELENLKNNTMQSDLGVNRVQA